MIFVAGGHPVICGGWRVRASGARPPGSIRALLIDAAAPGLLDSANRS
jgi:hypothetical protein